jgi:hypothetical protein
VKPEEREGAAWMKPPSGPPASCLRVGRRHRVCVVRDELGEETRMGAGVLGQQAWGLRGGFGCSHKFRGPSRGPVGPRFWPKPPYLAMGAEVGGPT